eukprot:m51a1_g10929 putative aminophospholipid-transporting p-type atpase (1340) ;mRNA; r:131001-137091
MSNDQLVQNLIAEGLIRTDAITRVMRSVDRGQFTRTRDEAYADHPVQIGHGQTISAPHMHAMCLELLAPLLVPGARVLDVGSGSGYMTACFGVAIGKGLVVGIDINRDLVEWSIANVCRGHRDLMDKGVVQIKVGDGWRGDPVNAPFDVIHVGAAAESVPAALLDQLKPGGRMVIPVGQLVQELILIQKDEQGGIHSSFVTGVSPKHGRLLLVRELVAPHSHAPGDCVRVTGRLVAHDPQTQRAIVEDEGASLSVDVTDVGDFLYTPGKTYQFLGEMLEEDVLRARVARLVEGLNLGFLPMTAIPAPVSFVDPPEPFLARVKRVLSRRPKYSPRIISMPSVESQAKMYPANLVHNHKYNLFTFLPLTLYGQFKYFYNLYFLINALSQLIPVLKVGFLFTYFAPLIFVLVLALAKEGFDDVKRHLQDRRANSQRYQKLLPSGDVVDIESADIKVGHVIIVGTNERVPADLVLLKTTEKSGAMFIRTDQLDGETDWKLRRPLAKTQPLQDLDIANFPGLLYAEAPRGDIYAFTGKLSSQAHGAVAEDEPISVDNMLWANTVVASGKVIGAVVYTGSETRSSLNRAHPRAKYGQTENEINFLSKLLFALLFVLSVIMVAAQQFSGTWYVYLVRFMILFSGIIPISMRVNLDMAKMLYSLQIMWDKHIPGTVVRNSTLPEELGRVNYLFTDKTGTLTQNDMTFKKFHLGASCFKEDDNEALTETIVNALSSGTGEGKRAVKQNKGLANRALACVRAIALCHNVTPVAVEGGGTQYQASSPDEVALVKFTERVGLVLHQRDLQLMTLRNPLGEMEEYEILKVFPFTSTTKRMGIILRDKAGQITFFMKGADVVMLRLITGEGCEWMSEEAGNMAREGLRTLVFGYRQLDEQQYAEFAGQLHEAECALDGRDAQVAAVVATLEKDLMPLCVTGVEDKLQNDVRPTLEMLQHAGIKIWMLTGDKIETATCIAISARLFKPTHHIKVIAAHDVQECKALLDDFITTPNAVLVIDGSSLQMCLDHLKEDFVVAASKSPSVACCRCSPTQKASIVTLIKTHSQARTCAIGDGGNDVSMILAADVGVGIEGKEGKQASLAADFSLTQFSHVGRLMMWHGRNCYKRSAALAQFVMHRGLIISFVQAAFSSIFFFAAISLYQGWLLVGYSTYYTMAPVFSLVFDHDVEDTVAMQFPELYRELQNGRTLSMRTFTMWMFTSVYQGGMIMLCSLFLFEDNFLNIVSITFTVLILTELLNIAFEIYSWSLIIILAEVVSLLLYFISMLCLPTYFDITFIFSWAFWWRVMAITAISCFPITLTRWVYRHLYPASWRIVTESSSSSSPKNRLLKFRF